MSESLTGINQEILNGFLIKNNPDSVFLSKELIVCEKILESEKNNITESGEEALVKSIETEFSEYRDSVNNIINNPTTVGNLPYLVNKFGSLHQKLDLLSQINGTAIEMKTDDAKASSKKATTQMTILGTLCFLIALSFTYSFGTYYNDRIYQLHKGIKEIVSSNYNQRLYFEGKDEFYEISLAFNEMAEKLGTTKPKVTVVMKEENEPSQSLNLIMELKNSLIRLKGEEQRALDIISQLENR
jgi:methyl-accepting chemotaxis protein